MRIDEQWIQWWAVTRIDELSDKHWRASDELEHDAWRMKLNRLPYYDIDTGHPSRFQGVLWLAKKLSVDIDVYARDY